MFSKIRKTKKAGVKISNPRRKWMTIGIVTILVFGGAGAYFVSRSSATACQQIELHRGSSGDCVAAMQTFLKTMGYTNTKGQELVADGQFGPSTEQAVKKAQADMKKQGYDPNLAVDGWYGPKTKAAMCAAAKEVGGGVLTAAYQTACTQPKETTTDNSKDTSKNKPKNDTNSNPSGGSSEGNGNGGNSNTTNNNGGTGTSNTGNAGSSSGSGNTSQSPSASSISCSVTGPRSVSRPTDANPKIVVSNNSNATVTNSDNFSIKVTVTGGLTVASGPSKQEKTISLGEIRPHASRTITLRNNYFSFSDGWYPASSPKVMTVKAQIVGGGSCAGSFSGRSLSPTGPGLWE